MLRKVNKGALLLGVVTLATCWLAVLLIDSANLFQLGETLIERSNRDASLFVLLFDDNRPIEWAQWFCIMSACVTAAYISAFEQSRGQPARYSFFLLFSFLFAIMLIEDAGNIRHGLIDLWSSLEFYPGISRYFTLAFYGLVAILPVSALLLYGRSFIRRSPIYYIFFLGFFFYFLAASFSATATFGWWYISAGEFLNTILFDNRVIYAAADHPPTGYWITDMLVEETIELIGALFFLLFGHRYCRGRISKYSET